MGSCSGIGSLQLRNGLLTRCMQGKEAAAESEWNFACDRISVGCSRYTDPDWLTRIRSWQAPAGCIHEEKI